MEWTLEIESGQYMNGFALKVQKQGVFKIVVFFYIYNEIQS